MISVCMATFNGERFIKEQIDSILVQLEKDDELIISDDGSTDKTLEIIASYNDPRIKVFHHQKDPDLLKLKFGRSHSLTSDNFQNAINHAQGDYIFLSDQDDVWVSTKKEKMILAMESQNVDCVMSNFDVIDENDNQLKIKILRSIPYRKSIFLNLFYGQFFGCAMAFKKEFKEIIMPFPKKIVCHDLWIGILAVHLKNFFYIDEPLHHYRRHGCNVSASIGKSNNPLLFKIKYRVDLFFQAFFRSKKIIRNI